MPLYEKRQYRLGGQRGRLLRAVGHALELAFVRGQLVFAEHEHIPRADLVRILELCLYAAAYVVNLNLNARSAELVGEQEKQDLLCRVLEKGAIELLPAAARRLADHGADRAWMTRILLRRAEASKDKGRYAFEALGKVNCTDPALIKLLRARLRKGDPEDRIDAGCQLAELGEPCNGLLGAMTAYAGPRPSFWALTSKVRRLASSWVQPISEFRRALSVFHRDDKKDLLATISSELIKHLAFPNAESKIEAIRRNAARLSFYLGSDEAKADDTAIEPLLTACRGAGGPRVPDAEDARLILFNNLK